METIPQTAD